jgi:hypothetical protein
LLVVLGLALLAAGGLVGWAIAWDEPPSPLAQATAGGTVALTWQDYDDARTVSLALTPGPESRLQAPRAGRVTAWACALGGEAQSGQSSLGLDGRPLLNLATALPLWRDLTYGNAGADVAALAQELARLGHWTGDPPEWVNQALIEAFQQAARAVGQTSDDWPYGTIPVDATVWLPQPAVAWDDCQAALGDTVAPGQTLADFARPVAGANISPLPQDLAPGARTVAVGGQTLPVDDNGVVSDPAALAQLAAWPAVRQALGPQGTGTVTGRYALAQPISVALAPAVAVMAASDGSACLLGDGQPVAASVVGSQLGEVFLQFTGPAPEQVSLAPGPDLRC